jgi:hypothetical protein
LNGIDIGYIRQFSGFSQDAHPFAEARADALEIPRETAEDAVAAKELVPSISFWSHP